MPEWSVYVLRCRDGSLYTGIATDVTRRIGEHEDATRGARYLRGRGPLKLKFARVVGDRSTATRIEHRIKQLPRCEKEDVERLAALVEGFLSGIERSTSLNIS